MILGILYIIAGVITWLGAFWKGDKAAASGNTAGVLWNAPWVVIGVIAVMHGINLVGGSV